MPSRRTFLRHAGRGAVALAGVSVLSGGASALARDEHKPDHVTLTFDEGKLDRYRPRLVFEESSRDQLIGLYGWYATSPEHETDVAVYWASYTHQDGVTMTDLDSHYGDHEPIYVFVDSVTGDVQRIHYSAYHWLKGTAVTDREHPRFRVFHPHHHYIKTETEGVLVGVEDLHDVFDSWLTNGLEEDLAPGSVVNPWSMKVRQYWWRKGTFGISLPALRATARLFFGRDGAEEVDI